MRCFFRVNIPKKIRVHFKKKIIVFVLTILKGVNEMLKPEFKYHATTHIHTKKKPASHTKQKCTCDMEMCVHAK